MKHFGFLTLVALLLVTGLTQGCKDDTTEVTTAKIFGTITIDNVDVWDTWRDSGEVQLTLFPEFSLDPPAGWGPVPDGFFGPGVPGGTFALGAPFNSQNPIVLEYSAGANQFDYEITLDPMTFSALALGFRHDFVTDPSKRTATLGVHWGNPNAVSHGVVLKVDVGGGQIMTIFDEPAPDTFTVKAGDELELNFRADFAFVEQWFD